MAPSKRYPNQVLILSLIILLGVILRLYRLQESNFWFDEASGTCNAVNFFSFITSPVYNYRPVYLFLLNRWIEVFGISALATRFLSVLFGVGSIFMTYKIGKELFNSKIGLISSSILSISCFHIYHSRQVRPESLLLFLILLSLLSFIKFLSQKKLIYLTLNSLLNILIIYTHPFGFSVALIQVFYIVFSCRSILKSAFRVILISQLGLLLVSGALFYCNILLQENYFKSILWWSRVPTITKITETFQTFCYGGPRYGLETISFQTSPFIVTCIAVIVFFTFFIRGLYAIASRKVFTTIKKGAYLVIFWLFLPPILVFLFSYIYFPAYMVRTFLICLPAFYLIVSVGVNFNNRLFFKIAVLFVILTLNLIPLSIMYNNNGNVDWGKVVLLMKQHAVDNNATIIISTKKEIVPFMYYFSNKDKKALKDLSLLGKFDNGQWHDSFQYKDHYIIGIADELSQNKSLCYSSRLAPEHNIYCCNYIISEFDREILGKDILKTDKQIWLLISGWTTVGNECISNLIIHLRQWFEIKTEGEVGGIKVFILQVRNKTKDQIVNMRNSH